MPDDVMMTSEQATELVRVALTCLIEHDEAEATMAYAADDPATERLHLNRSKDAIALRAMFHDKRAKVVFGHIQVRYETPGSVSS